MTRVLFLLICLCLSLLAGCTNEPATQPANPDVNTAATPIATPNTGATPLANATPTPPSLVADAKNDTSWQKDFGGLVPFIKRIVKVGMNPDQVITDQEVQWTVTFRKFVPGSTDPNAISAHPMIDFNEADAAAKAKPWIQVVALGKDSEAEKLKNLKAGARITMRCRMAGVTTTEKNVKQGRILEGVVLSAEECVIGN